MAIPRNIIVISSEPLPSLDAITGQVMEDGTGATSTFTGTTRNVFQGKQVLQLSYEAYIPMATKILHELVAQARAQWLLHNVVIYHRTGIVAVREPSVIVAVSSAHRKESLRAVEFLIDELKTRCPIWKKEWYADGSVWKENSNC